jgi:hypoxanthine-guanine phosphoribosyltransferase
LLVAKGVYAKLIEEENVKIRVESVGQDINEEKHHHKFLIIALGFIGFLILAGVLFVKLFN